MLPEFIYFDLGQVLCYFDRQQEMRQVAEVSGAPEAKVTEVLIGAQGLLWRYETGELDDRQFHEAFCRATETKPDMAAFLKANAEIFTLNGSIVPLVGHLEDAGIPLGILSNTCDSHWQVVADGRYGIIPDAFKSIVLSYEVKSLKPDAKIYQRAIELAGVPAEKIFYVDDVQGHVDGAKRAGFDAVQYTTTDSLLKELLARGVRCNI
jgi:putative hydrolase of the HAD superfamily